MKALSHWTEDLVECSGDRLPDELLDRILAIGERARPRLVEFATDPEYRGLAGRGAGFVTLHATDVLSEMPFDDATVAALVASIEAAPTDPESEDLVACLARLGPRARPRIVAALDATTSPDVALSLVQALAASDSPGDSAILAVARAIERFPGDVAVAASCIHDERLVAPLRAAFARHHVGAGSSADDDESALSMAFALEELGAELTADEVRKRDLAERRASRRIARDAPPESPAGDDADDFDDDDDDEDFDEDDEFDFDLGTLPEPNDPCPCGSGRKFKKCHEGDPRLSPPPADGPA